MSGIQTPPACLPACLAACLSACLPAWLPAFLPACLPACLPAFLSPLSESLEQVNELLLTALGIEDEYVDVHLLVLILNA